MSKPLDKAQEIISQKGDKLMQRDLDAIQALIIQTSPEEWGDVLLLMEGVALIVNHPLYSGDIEPIE